MYQHHTAICVLVNESIHCNDNMQDVVVIKTAGPKGGSVQGTNNDKDNPV